MQIKRLLSGSLIYMVASVLAGGIPFLVLPVLTQYLSPAEFGNVGLFQSIYTVFLATCGLGISGSIIRQSYDVDAEGIGVYVFNALLILMVTTLGLSILLWIFGRHLSEWLLIPEQYFYYALIAAFMVFTINILLGQLQVSEKPLRYGIIQIGHSFLSVAVSLIGIIVFAAGAMGRIGGILLSAVVFGVFALFALRAIGRLTCKVNVNDMKSALRYGVPLLPHELNSFVLNWLSLIIINMNLDAGSAGLYMLAFQVSMVLGVICDALNRAYVPWLFSILKGELPTDRVQVVRLTYIYFTVLIAIVVLTFLMAHWFVGIAFAEKYAEAAWMIGWLVLGQAFGGAYLMVTNYIAYRRRTERLSLITLLGSAVNVALLCALMPAYGLQGAVIAFVVARAVIFAMTWYSAQRLIPMPWWYRWSK
jgi:O-antigen/teichoic acid export membrane protein